MNTHIMMVRLISELFTETITPAKKTKRFSQTVIQVIQIHLIMKNNYTINL